MTKLKVKSTMLKRSNLQVGMDSVDEDSSNKSSVDNLRKPQHVHPLQRIKSFKEDDKGTTDEHKNESTPCSEAELKKSWEKRMTLDQRIKFFGSD